MLRTKKSKKQKELKKQLKRKNHVDNMSATEIPYMDMNIELEEPSLELLKVAESELRETPERRKEALDELRDLVLAEKNLYCRTDDKFLIRFLRPCKFYVDSAFERLQNYYRHIEKYSRVYEPISPNKQAEVVKDFVVAVSPYRDHKSRRILCVRFGHWNPRKYSLDDLYRAVIMMIEMGASEPQTQIAGGIALFDMEGMSFSQVMYLSLGFARRCVDLVQGNFPLRFKGYHIVNQHKLFDIVYSMFKQLLIPKMKDRVYLHGTDWESLHRHIRPEALPTLYGGTMTSVDTTRLIQVLNENANIFEDVNKYGYGKSEDSSDNDDDTMNFDDLTRI